jgi:GAF domain-containing protein
MATVADPRRPAAVDVVLPGHSDAALESDTLYGVIKVIASSPDLDRVLNGVVDVLTKATRCHACFIYLRRGDRLRLRAASNIYAEAVGEVEFGLDEGLAGWVATRNQTAFIRENALDDPRTNHVPQLEEERFQSMVAVPISSRGGTIMGVIVLHTIAPREFDVRTLNMITHTAPLMAGVIENAQLYEDARRRVATLSALSTLSQRIAAVAGREELYLEATRGVRSLLGSDHVRLYALDPQLRQLELVAADPPPDGDLDVRSANVNAILLDLLAQRERRDDASMRRVRDALAFDAGIKEVRVASLAAGGEHLGVLVSASSRALRDDAGELLKAVANQAAVALKKAELIERLTDDNIVRDLFAALERGDPDDAKRAAHAARCEIASAHVFIAARRSRESEGAAQAWAQIGERVERGLRRHVPGALCDVGADDIRALVPLPSGGSDRELGVLDETLDRLARASGVSIGRSEARNGPEDAPDGLRQAAHAAQVGGALKPSGTAMAYRDLGPYRYLVHLMDGEAGGDPLLEAIQVLREYDRRRGSQLVATLEQYLADRRGVTETARTLMVHPNTLRQRLERIEVLTGLDLAREDLLTLEMALKVEQLRSPRR